MNRNRENNIGNDADSDDEDYEAVLISEREYQELRENKAKIAAVESVLSDDSSVSDYQREAESEYISSGHDDREDVSSAREGPPIKYQGPASEDFIEDTQVENADKSPFTLVEEEKDTEYSMGANHTEKGVATFRKFSFWSALSTFFLFIAVTTLLSTGYLSAFITIPVGVLLLASSIIFIKLWNDLRSANIP